MNRLIISAFGAVAMMASTTPEILAQRYNPFEIGASGGIGLPTGDLGTGTNTGYSIALAVGYRPQYTPLAVRAEAAYNQFGFDAGGGSINIPAFTGNIEYDLPLGMSFTPYAIGGVGLYRPSADFSGGGTTGSENRFGWNAGGGVKIPFSRSFKTFIEARYNSVNVQNGTLSFIPITVGVMF